MERLLGLLASGRVDPTPMTTHTFDFDDIERAFEMMDNEEDGIIEPLIASVEPSCRARSARVHGVHAVAMPRPGKLRASREIFLGRRSCLWRRHARVAFGHGTCSLVPRLGSTSHRRIEERKTP